MLQQYHTKLKGTLALTDSYLTEKTLQKEKGLYKFIWVRNGSITVEIDHQEMTLTQDEVFHSLICNTSNLNRLMVNT